MYRTMTLTVLASSLLLAGGLTANEQSPESAVAVDWRASTFAKSTQGEGTLTTLPDGSVLVAWSSRRQQAGQYGVYAQRFDADGVALGGEVPVNLWRTSHQRTPALASTPTGAVVVWQSHGQDGDRGAIVARRFDTDMTGSDEILVNADAAGEQSLPIVATATDGTMLVAWETLATAQGTTRIHVRPLSGTGTSLTPAGDEITPLPQDDRHRSQPALAAHPEGGYVLTYAVADADRRPQGIEAQRLDAAGHAVGEPIRISGAATQNQVEPTIAAGPNDFVVAWVDSVSDGSSFGILAARLSSDCTMTTTPVVINETTDGRQNGAAIAIDADGRTVIGWNTPDGDSTDVVAREFDAAGHPVGAEFPITTASDGRQQLSPAMATTRLAFTAEGNLLCVWDGDAGLGDASAVHVSLMGESIDDLRPGLARGITAMPDVDVHAAVPLTAQPHEPPVFDRNQVERGEREIVSVAGAVTGFTGIINTGWTPPDPHMAVGPNHVVIMTNGAIAYFQKDGTLDFQDEIEDSFGFWGSVGASGFVYDPEVLYDPMSGRFFAIAGESGPGSQSYALIAVSDDDNPNGTWHKYRLNTTPQAGPTYDSINIGVDDDTVYVTGDGFGGPWAYPVFAYDKASFLAGNPPAQTTAISLPTSTQSAGIPPVTFDDPPALYMVEHREGNNQTSVRLIAFEDPLTSPSFTSINVTVPSYGHPEDPPQMGTSTEPETFDARFWSCAYRNGSLWATHHINGNRVLARWYEFDMNGWPTSGQNPTLVQSGNIDFGGSVRTFFTAITCDEDNNAAIVCARSGPDEFISMNLSYRAATDPLGQFPTSMTVQTNSAGYTNGRWGDYASVQVDPIDGSIWAHHEYAIGSSWRTWVSRFQPGPPTPANDECGTAPIVVEGVTPFTTLGATTDGFDETGCTGFGDDVWYRHVAQCTGTLTVSVCGADYDSALAVYGSSCPTGPLEALACNDDACGQASEISMPIVPGLYYIRIGSTSGATGSGDLNITCTPEVDCDADCGDEDGSVGIADLLELLSQWGGPGGCDLSGNGSVGIEDLLELLAQWGDCP